MGNLFIVATPIGNLQDITLRAISILKNVEFIACEDTRKTGLLLKQIGVEHKPFLISFYEQNEDARIPNILNTLKNGKDVALVSDAGTPTVSDPGFRLVREVINQGGEVVSIPGPSSVISALVSSGLPTDKFTFIGFLPKKPGHRSKLLNDLYEAQKKIESTIIFFESPFRIEKTLIEVEEIFGDVYVVIAREMTKIHEEIIRGRVSEIKKNKINAKGEMVVLISLKR